MRRSWIATNLIIIKRITLKSNSVSEILNMVTAIIYLHTVNKIYN